MKSKPSRSWLPALQTAFSRRNPIRQVTLRQLYAVDLYEQPGATKASEMCATSSANMSQRLALTTYRETAHFLDEACAAAHASVCTPRQNICSACSPYNSTFNSSQSNARHYSLFAVENIGITPVMNRGFRSKNLWMFWLIYHIFIILFYFPSQFLISNCLFVQAHSKAEGSVSWSVLCAYVRL